MRSGISLRAHLPGLFLRISASSMSWTVSRSKTSEGVTILRLRFLVLRYFSGNRDLTNELRLSVQDVVELCSLRWQIELFFKELEPAAIGGVYPCCHRRPSFHAAARHERGTSCCRAMMDVKRRRASVPRCWCRAAVSHVAAAILFGPQATAGYSPCRNRPAGRHPIAAHHQPVRLPDFRRLHVHCTHGERHESLNIQKGTDSVAGPD
jgi:hypothetical protein